MGVFLVSVREQKGSGEGICGQLEVLGGEGFVVIELSWLIDGPLKQGFSLGVKRFFCQSKLTSPF